MTVDVTAIDHIYIAVSDFARAEAFYDRVMKLLGFRKGTKSIAGDPHRHYFNRVTQYSIRPARDPSLLHDPYRPGLHHLCFRVASRADVDHVARELTLLGIDASAPETYPEYADDYYATFFSDPDGIRLEVVAHRRMRTVVVERWDELVEFEDPIGKAGIK